MSEADNQPSHAGGFFISRRGTAMTEMLRLNVNITSELRQCLARLEADEKLGSLVERLLREHADVERARKALKIKFTDRAGPGWKLGVPRAGE